MKRKCIVFKVAMALVFSMFVMPIVLFAQNEERIPGTNQSGVKPLRFQRINAITPFSTETGFISLSVDGLGSNDASGIISVQKPAGATVRKAFMAAASTGFSGRILANGDVTINGTGVNWNVVASTPSSISSSNSLADVTSIVKPVVDAAPTGRVNFTITEVSTLGIDGEILAVVFNDPNQTVSNTVVLLFGAQNIAGDQFAIGLANPINLSDPNLKLDLGLGISFSFQQPPGNINQISRIDVNTVRMSTAAGGQDDGPFPGANGSLLTMGGLDDSNNNPPPLGPPSSGDSIPDDELYNLIPFVANGTTLINVNTINPSNDDNIFFASLFLGSQTAVVGEGILLAPLSDTNNVGTTHTVTATVQNSVGQPIVGRVVTFRVKGGPHTGQTGTGTTNTAGQTTFTYPGTIVGTDTLIARMTTTTGQPDSSNTVRKLWRAITTTNPPGFISPTPTCGTTLNANVGQAFTFTVTASDPDAGNTVTLTSNALPTGATMTPALPTTGNPVQSVFNWTLGTTQTGLFTIIFTATDNTALVTRCTLSINVASGPPPDITPPSCTISPIIPGPPIQIQITLRDQQSGLASIVPVTLVNATLNIPSFTVGTTSPVVVTATKVNQTLASTVLIRATDVAGNSITCDPVYTTISAEIPQEFALGTNYPNPFNPTTRITFSVAKTEAPTSVTLKVYDLLGREVKTLLSEPMQAGQYFVEWDGTNDQGVAVTSGIYITRMVAGEFIATRRMTLMK